MSINAKPGNRCRVQAIFLAHRSRSLAEQHPTLLFRIDPGRLAQLGADRLPVASAGRLPTVSSNHFVSFGEVVSWVRQASAKSGRSALAGETHKR